MKPLVILLIFIWIAIFLSCDPEKLLNGEDKAPIVSTIYSDPDSLNIEPNSVVKYWVTANDPDGGKLEFEWTCTKGTFLTSINVDSVNWKSPQTGGDATINLKVSNANKSVSKSRTVVVKSYDNPSVSIINPANNSYLVQYDQIEIKFDAYHNNGIEISNFYLNDSLLLTIPGHSANEYSFMWQVTGEAGIREIEIRSKSNSTAKWGSDKVSVYLEGVLPGKIND